MVKVEVKSILEYRMLIKKRLREQGLGEKQINQLCAAYLKIFKDGMDFANGNLRVEIEKE
jgi:hypothetical protein